MSSSISPEDFDSFDTRLRTVERGQKEHYKTVLNEIGEVKGEIRDLRALVEDRLTIPVRIERNTVPDISTGSPSLVERINQKVTVGRATLVYVLIEVLRAYGDGRLKLPWK